MSDLGPRTRRPRSPAKETPLALGVLLAPGAGANRDQPALVAIDRTLSCRGAVVERMDFPYRKAGRKAPDRPAVLISSVGEEARSLRERLGRSAAGGSAGARLVLGGRSMGGRMCSMAVAGGLPADALVLISYPLHPPGRPDKPRVEHLPGLEVPCLFVSGTRDAFGTRAELEEAASAIRGPVAHRWVEGKDHGMRGAEAVVADIVERWLESIGFLPPRS